MGKLYEHFNNLSFRNEAEVSQNFILPLLQEYLGYSIQEIIPENNYPVKNIYSGVKFGKAGSKSINHRPDYVICLNGNLNDPKFIVDSKGPDQSIDEHLGQLQSYAVSVRQNLMMITNGQEIKVYDVNNLLFHSCDIADLQERLLSLIALLGRDNQSLKDSKEIIKGFDFESSIQISQQQVYDEEVKRKRILLSDFQIYLENLRKRFLNWHEPNQNFHALSNLTLNKIDPNYLFSFRRYSPETELRTKEKSISLFEIESEQQLNIKVFIGETGSGKTSLLKFLANKAVENCLDYEEVKIPVFVSLRDIGHGYKLEDLIVASLNRGGYKCNSIYDLPKSNDFIFFLDAWDEVASQFVSESFDSIENLGTKYECYITSRLNRVPHLHSSVAFTVLPISERQIKHIVRHHIGDRYYSFQYQLEKNNLLSESGNILLLLFLISLYKETGALPLTGFQVIKSVVRQVKGWQETKSLRDRQLRWEQVEQFLAALAFRMIECESTGLQMMEAEAILREEVVELEQKRAIHPGSTVYEIIEGLTESGLFIANSDHVYFWHGLFLNYFSGLGLKDKYGDNLQQITNLVHEEKWKGAIVGLASHLIFSTGLIQSIKSNIWLSAYCLIENSNCSDEVVLQVISSLIAYLKSDIPNVRLRAISFLAQIDHNESRQFFFKSVDQDYTSDVRMFALSVIGKTRSEEALQIINRFLDWHESSFFVGHSSQAHIARALYYYGEGEHLRIVTNWSKVYDYFLDQECRNIFIQLHSQNKLTQKIISSLQDLFLKEYNEKPQSRDKLEALANILALVPDDEFANRVLDLTAENRDVGKADAIYTLLKSYNSTQIIQRLVKEIFDHPEHDYLTETLAKVIVDSEYLVSEDVYYKFIDHPNTNIASKGISGLKRFPYKSVQQVIEKHLYGEDPQLQSWALNVLIDNGVVVSLIRNRQFPSKFYFPAAYQVLKASRRYHLAEVAPLMDRIFQALQKSKTYEDEPSLAVELAGTYYLLGRADRQAEIVSWFFDGKELLQKSDHVHFHLLKGLKYLDPSLSMQIIDSFFCRYYPFNSDKAMYNLELFLETVEELGFQPMIHRVKETIELLLNKIKTDPGEKTAKFRLERPMRTLVTMAQPPDQDWLLERLDEMKFDDGFQFPQLRRAVECLAYIGSLKAIPYIKQIANQLKSNEAVINVCQVAFEQICLRENVPITAIDIFQA